MQNCSYLNATQHDGTLFMKSARQKPHPKMKSQSSKRNHRLLNLVKQLRSPVHKTFPGASILLNNRSRMGILNVYKKTTTKHKMAPNSLSGVIQDCRRIPNCFEKTHPLLKPNSSRDLHR